jgi:hypothetical protein
MLDFLQELKEARLYRGADTLQGKSADELAKITYAMIMILEILRHEDNKFAKKYVDDTIGYENFSAMRSNATDLHNLLSVLNNQSDYENKITVNHNISVPVLQIKRWMRDISSGHKDKGLDRTLFMKLESFFKISDSQLKQIRRSVGDWNDTSTNEKSVVRKQIKNFLQGHGQQNDLLIQIKHYIHG